MDTSASPYGSGLAFPVGPGAPARPDGWSRVEGEDAVAQALRTLLLTEPGERIRRPGYGCGLRRFWFAPNSVATRAMIEQSVTGAIKSFESRVALEGVNVRADPSDPSLLLIDVRYRLASAGASGVPGSLVLPFYLDDRTS